MRKRLLTAISLLLCFSACRESALKNSQTKASLTPAKDSVATAVIDSSINKRSDAEFSAWMQSLERPMQYLRAPADKVSTVRGAKGTRIRIQPSDLEHSDGSHPQKEIVLELIELQRKADFIRARMPTVSGSRLLESGGAYFINLTSGGRQLRLKTGKTLAVMLPKISDKEMELFHAGKDASGGVDWKPANKKFQNLPGDYDLELEADVVASTTALGNDGTDSMMIREPILKYKDTILADMIRGPDGKLAVIDMDKFRGYGNVGMKTIDGHPYLVARTLDTTNQQYRTVMKKGRALDILAGKFYDKMRLEQFGWINCDRFLPDEMIAVDAELPMDIAFEKVETFFVFSDVNSVLNRTVFPGGKQRSPFGTLPSRRAKVIALAWRDGKPYASVQSVTLARGVPVKLDLQPTTKAAVERIIEDA